MSGTDRSAEQTALRRQIRAEVEKKMRMRGGLAWHVAVFTVVNLFLIMINEMFSPGFQWFIFPLAGWGIGLFFHTFAVLRSGQSEALIEAEVERELLRREARSA